MSEERHHGLAASNVIPICEHMFAWRFGQNISLIGTIATLPGE